MWYKNEKIIIAVMGIILVVLLCITNERDFNEVTVPVVGKVEDPIDDGIPIISQTTVTEDDAKEWARLKGATEEFIGLADLYWSYAKERGNVNPTVAYIQAAKETGYGKFGGVINSSYYNPCGLKVNAGGGDYDPDAHKKFLSWEEGIQAHLDHLALYAGAENYPRKDTPDPRHFDIIYGKAKTVASLGANWAPSPTYGEEIVRLYNDLLDTVGKVEVFVTK